MTDDWKVNLTSTWDVLGPFPIHAREQYFISPSFPLDLTQQIDYTKTWPSSYARNGVVPWTSTTADDLGNIQVSFPDIPWAYVRSTNGWAALQHHAVLRSTLTISPPSPRVAGGSATKRPKMFISLKQASYFALRPHTKDPQQYIPQWHPGNIYDLERPLTYTLPLPDDISTTEPTSFDLFVSGDYEIRLFGDPLSNGSEIPVQHIQVQITLQHTPDNLLRLPVQDVVPHFVAGIPFGQPMGVALQSLDKKWTVIAAKSTDNNEILHVSLLNDAPFTISPGQIRVVPLLLRSSSPWLKETLELVLALKSEDTNIELPVTVKLKHHKSWLMGERQAIVGTFWFGRSTPSFFMAMPPRLQSTDAHPPILALHGAGVDIIEGDFWPKAMPENKYSWIVMAVGRTSWGLDWHGPSTSDAWGAVEGLGEALSYHRKLHDCPWSFSSHLPVVLIGHSNGGQGTWYMASRYPDRVLAAVPAAGYMKSQSYVPLIQSRGGHFVDPSLRAILESSLTPDDNDLHVSNLVDTPVYAIHGGDDRNVPSWHTRELMATIDAYNYTGVKKSYREDFGEDHWYPTVLNNAEVQSFVDELTSQNKVKAELDDTFTLTTAAPQQNGSLRGWKIVELITPGRLGRLTVKRISSDASNVVKEYRVETSNIRLFSLPRLNRSTSLRVDDVEIPNDAQGSVSATLQLNDERLWTWQASDTIHYTQPPGRVQAILTSPGPITIVVTTLDNAHEYSVALRFAYVLYLYHRIDSEIIDEEEAMLRTFRRNWDAGNVVMIGTPASLFMQALLVSPRFPVGITDDHAGFTVLSKQFKRDDQSMIFTYPQPTYAESSWLCLLYNSPDGLERAARLFPYRTGVPVPDWAVLSSKMDSQGAGGIIGAGVWSNDWSFNESMSWMY